jgi:hypothetical protein
MPETAREILYSDMSACRPEDGMSRDWKENSWFLVDYETYDEVKGIMVFADPVLRAPELELPLNAKGLYQVYLGINYTKSDLGGFSTRYSYNNFGGIDPLFPMGMQ